MSELSPLVVRVSLDTSGFDKAVGAAKRAGSQIERSIGQSLTNAGKGISRAGVAMTKTVTTAMAGAAAGIYKATQMASDLNETISKSQVVFGDGFKTVNKWSNNAVEKLLLTKEEALDAASTFAIFGKSAGLTGNELADFSTNLVQAAADAASFNNDADATEATMAFGAALRGEFEPIRRYGVLLNDVALQAAAVEAGLVKTTVDTNKVTTAKASLLQAQEKLNKVNRDAKATEGDRAAAAAKVQAAEAKLSQALGGKVGKLDQQTKILAAQRLIFEQLGESGSNTLGDVARTGDNFAAQQKKMRKELAQSTTELGQAFLPVMADFVKIARDDLVPAIKKAITIFKEMSPTTRKNIVIVGGLAAALGPVVAIIGKFTTGIGALVTHGPKLITAFNAVRTAISAVTTALAANPWMLAIAAVILLAVLVVKHWGAIKKFVLGAVEMLKEKVTAAFTAIGDFVGGLGSKLADMAKTAWSMYVHTALEVLSFLPGQVIKLLEKIPGFSKFGLSAKLEAAKNSVSKTLGAGSMANNNPLGSALGNTNYYNFNVNAQGLHTDEVIRDTRRRANLMAPTGARG